jgi:hypothetical protein
MKQVALAMAECTLGSFITFFEPGAEQLSGLDRFLFYKPTSPNRFWAVEELSYRGPLSDSCAILSDSGMLERA